MQKKYTQKKSEKENKQAYVENHQNYKNPQKQVPPYQQKLKNHPDHITAKIPINMKKSSELMLQTKTRKKNDEKKKKLIKQRPKKHRSNPAT